MFIPTEFALLDIFTKYKSIFVTIISTCVYGITDLDGHINGTKGDRKRSCREWWTIECRPEIHNWFLQYSIISTETGPCVISRMNCIKIHTSKEGQSINFISAIYDWFIQTIYHCVADLLTFRNTWKETQQVSLNLTLWKTLPKQISE